MPNIIVARNMVKDAIIKAIQESAEKAFQASKPRTPVKTGHLKNSATRTDLPNGARLFYPAPYASYVEKGVRAMYVNVRAYWHSNGYQVKAHRRWQPYRPPLEFIKKSMDETFNQFGDSVDSNLRNSFSNVTRR